MHVHLGHPYDPPAQVLEEAEHHDHSTLFVSGHDESHSESHLSHGDVDIGAPDITAGKLPTMPLLLALLGTAFAFLLLPRTSPMVRPAPYVPIHRRRVHVLPPSQAPPLAS